MCRSSPTTDGTRSKDVVLVFGRAVASPLSSSISGQFLFAVVSHIWQRRPTTSRIGRLDEGKQQESSTDKSKRHCQQHGYVLILGMTSLFFVTARRVVCLSRFERERGSMWLDRREVLTKLEPIRSQKSPKHWRHDRASAPFGQNGTFRKIPLCFCTS